MAPRLPIYLDHHATTPVDPRVLEAMLPYFGEAYGNPASSTHRYGWAAEAAVEQARETIALAVGAADPAEIVFTSGTTESDNLALKGVMRAGRRRGDHLVTSAIEHPAVLDTARALETEGFRVTELPVDADGLVEPAAVAAAITDRTLLVSIMAANSEVGVVQDLQEIGRVCRERGVLFHSDAAQAVGRLPLDVQAQQIDLLSFCAHKLYGPKGIGALYVRNRRPRVRLEPLLHGGGHERGRRSGTLPVPLIVGFGKALEICGAEREAEAARLAGLRDRLWQGLQAQVPGVSRNGHPTRRLPGNLSVCFEGLEADALLVGLGDVALSSGSACASASGEPSHVLLALGLSEGAARSALRFGLGRSNTTEEIDHVVKRVAEEVRALRAAAAPRRRLSGR
ncbi:MAG: cysteine desulfurase family protein [Myxococcota bacterium]|nr:cysteine desulfurase family protein [Myxococcota bacterium]